MRRDRGSRKLLITLAASFTLTIASFLVARVVSEDQAQGIRDAAEQIDEALPAVELLTKVRTELGRTDALLDALEAAAPSSTEIATLERDLGGVRERRTASWSRYVALPVVPDERAPVEAAVSHFADLDASIDRALGRFHEGDTKRGIAELHERAAPALARADEQVRNASEVNQRLALSASASIAEHRDASRSWGYSLDLLSVLFSAISAYAVARLFRRFAELAEERIGELEHFAARVAHDLRGPLGTAALAVEVAKRADGTSALPVLERATRTLQRAGTLVDGLLLFAMASKGPTEQRSADVNDVLEGIVEDLRANAEERGIEVRLTMPETHVRAACAPGVLVSLASNLLGNALKYMGEATLRRVEVNARAGARAVRVEVRDTGPGVPPELQPRIFDPHVRGASTTIPGLGLGLATVRHLAEAHGGAVGVESTPGAGSLFWFELPCASEAT